MKKLIFTAILFLHSFCQAEELLSVVKTDGSTIKEVERKETLSVLNISYSDAIKNSMASSGMFSMYAACQIAKARGATHFIMLEKKQKDNEVLVVGITSTPTDTISKWKKYKGKFPVQDLLSYEEGCSGVEKFYGNK